MVKCSLTVCPYSSQFIKGTYHTFPAKFTQFKNFSILKARFSNSELFIVNEKAFLHIKFKSQIKNSSDNSNNLFEFAVCSTNKKSVDLFKSVFN